jgi:hypothetical protein
MTTTDTAPAEGTTETAGKPATSANTTKTPKQCGCLAGTGQTCDRTTGKAFAQGHDARMASRLAQAVSKGEMAVEDAAKLITDAGGSDLLVGKMKHSAELRKTNASKPKAAKKDKAAESEQAPEQADTPEAKASASAGDQLLGTKVKVAHGDKTYDAVVLKNAAGTRVARHRLIGQNCDHSVTDDGQTGDKIK